MSPSDAYDSTPVSGIMYSIRLEAYHPSITAIPGEVYEAVSSLERRRRREDEPRRVAAS